MDQSYSSNGFFIVKNCVPLEEINGVNAQILDFLNEAITIRYDRISREVTIFGALRSIYDIDLDFYKSVIGSLWRFSPVARLMRSPSIEAAVKKCLNTSHLFLPGGDVVHIMCSKLVIPDGYHGLNAHQDWPSVRGSRDGLVAWLPLTDVTRDTFPIEIIIGSHKYGIFPGKGCKERPWEISLAPYTDVDFVPVECSAGDLVIFSNYLIHRSSIHGASDAFRLAASTRFDNGEDEDYLARGLPTAYKRSVERLEI
jgi:ectoine hydroxylase-related dioxygenase (phytanoyl-CoA dioxygenase family)